MKTKPFSSFIPINIQTQQQLKTNNSGEKQNSRMSSMSNQHRWMGEQYLLYSTIYRYALFYLFFVHALCNGDHNNIPKQAHEGGQMFSHDWNRIVQAMDATENKTDGKIPGNGNVGPEHTWWPKGWQIFFVWV